jgi:hypothetical protein
MTGHNVVARFRDGKLLKGRTNDFTPFKMHFHIKLLNEKVVTVDLEDLKALFFVRDFKGEKYRPDRLRHVRELGGQKVRVYFYDGEIITGFAMEYSSKDFGFFMTPAGSRDNNERVFVVASATEKISFL